MTARCLFVVLALMAAPVASWAGPASPIYETQCSVCHQSAGKGAPGQYPRLAGRTSSIAGDPKGRAYLVGVLLYGMSGKITVGDETLMGVMPGFAKLSNKDVADVLNYIVRIDAGGRSTTAFTPAEIAAARTKSATPQAMNAARKALSTEGLIR